MTALFALEAKCDMVEEAWTSPVDDAWMLPELAETEECQERENYEINPHRESFAPPVIATTTRPKLINRDGNK